MKSTPLGKLIVFFNILAALIFVSEVQAEFKWKFPSIFSDPATVAAFNAHGKGQKMFADLVNQRSNGQIKITPYFSSVLGGEREMFEALKREDIELAFINPLGGADKRFDAWAIPYIASTYDEMDRILCKPEAPMHKIVSGWLDSHKVKLLGIGEAGFRGCLNKVRPINNVKDLKDLKIRVYQSPICFAFWKKVAVAAPLPWAEVYSALTTGTIDGLECPVNAVYAYKFYEGAKYFSFINWQWSSQMILMGKTAWESLSPGLQKIVYDTATEVALNVRTWQRDDSNAVVKKLGELGVKVNSLSPEAMKEFREVGTSLGPEFSKLIGDDVYKQVMAAAKSVQ